MEITWYGLSCFRIVERQHATVLTDPFGASVGLPVPKLKADIVTQSHDAPGHNNLDLVSGPSHVLTGPGEYEVGNVFVNAVALRSAESKRNIFYLFDFKGLTVAHPGNLSKLPSQSQVEALGEVNILLLPVGNGNSLGAVEAAELVSLIEPNIVIPMHFKTEGLQLELDGVERFLQEIGVSDLEPLTSLKVTSGNLPEETQIVLLSPKT